jgi:hypothetical protein
MDAAQTELDTARRKALYADFVRRVNTELPLWMPIEQIFVSVFNRACATTPTTRAGRRPPGTTSGSRPDRLMRVLALAGRRLAASLPTLVLILVGCSCCCSSPRATRWMR